MVRKIQKTFDWDVLVRCLAAVTAFYVVGMAVANSAAAHLGGRAARGLAGG